MSAVVASRWTADIPHLTGQVAEKPPGLAPVARHPVTMRYVVSVQYQSFCYRPLDIDCEHSDTHHDENRQLTDPSLHSRTGQVKARTFNEGPSVLGVQFSPVISLSFTTAPSRNLLRSAASIKANISRVSSGDTGGICVRKKLTISATKGP